MQIQHRNETMERKKNMYNHDTHMTFIKDCPNHP